MGVTQALEDVASPRVEEGDLRLSQQSETLLQGSGHRCSVQHSLHVHVLRHRLHHLPHTRKWAHRLVHFYLRTPKVAIFLDHLFLLHQCQTIFSDLVKHWWFPYIIGNWMEIKDLFLQVLIPYETSALKVDQTCHVIRQFIFVQILLALDLKEP